MSRPAEVQGKVHPKELKRFHRFNNRTSYRYWLTVATIIMQKINSHQLALTRVQLHVVTMSEAINVIYKVFYYRQRVTSSIVRSSTYLILGPQERTRSSTMTANKMGLSLVPWGIPPFGDLLADDTFASWTR